MVMGRFLGGFVVIYLFLSLKAVRLEAVRCYVVGGGRITWRRGVLDGPLGSAVIGAVDGRFLGQVRLRFQMAVLGRNCLMLVNEMS